MEAELGTCQTEIALLKSKDKIGEKERELLNHDFENVECDLGNVLMRMSVLESGENATLKKRLAETETKLVRARMKRETAERRLHESRVWNKRFYLNMVPMSEARIREIIRDQITTSMAEFVANINRETGGAGADGAVADSAGVDGTGAGSARASGAGADGARAGGVGVGGAGPAAPEITRCTYITFMNVNQTLLKAPKVKVEQYIRGLSKNIRGDVTSSRPAGIEEVVRMAYQLMGKIIQDKTGEVSKGEKRKGKGDHGSRGDNRRDYNRWQNQRRVNARAMTNAAPNDNEVCLKCKNKKHGEDCWNVGHRKRDCPKLKKNGQSGNNCGAVYKLRAMDAQQDPKVVTGTFLLNNRYATASFDSELGSFDIIIGIDWLSRYDAAILCGEKKVRIPLEGSRLLGLSPDTRDRLDYI
uniref:Reverse transcriptase domain-containing protein n=1 Tax=Tanacetum cinerariifolium TaxID=118510 RepID=A0A699JDI5_TANCI|nr:hypothetical protein [Tanacetum cinerariifolium]